MKMSKKRNEEKIAEEHTSETIEMGAETSEADEIVRKKIERLIEENQMLKDQLLRLAAEFDNFRKRINRDMTQSIQNANADLITRLLALLDDMDRIDIEDSSEVDAEFLLQGIKLIHKNFLKALEDEGLQVMESVGTEFDPEKHDAIIHMEVKDKDSNIVVEEHKKGYVFKDRVIRHAQVIVSK